MVVISAFETLGPIRVGEANGTPVARVTLNQPAQADTVVTVSSSGPELTVSNTTVLAGQTSAEILGTATSPGTVTLTVQVGTVTRTLTVQILPPVDLSVFHTLGPIQVG